MSTPIFTNFSSRFIITQHLITRISLLLLTLGFFGGVWGQSVTINTSTSTLGGSASYTTVESTATTGGYTYKLNNWIGNSSNIQPRGNQSTIGSNFYIYNTTAIPGNITGINITGTNLINSKINLIAGSSAITSSSGGSSGGASTTAGTSASWIVTGSNTFFRIQFINGATTGTASITSIVINYSSSPNITGSATATAFSTTYGTPSTAQTFSISGSNLTADITATAPSGFEVSSDGTTYGGTATFTQTSGSASGTLRVRLAANASVAGSYNSQNIALSSTNAPTVNITTASSGNAVSAKGLTISGLTASNKNWDGNTTVSVTGSPQYSGLVNGESYSVTGAVTWAFPNSNVGNNITLTRTGSFDSPSSNYSITQPTLTASIIAIVSSAPSISGITPGNTLLSIAFTAPSSNGGASITNYEYSTNGGSNWITPSPAVSSSPLVINGLINGTTYDIQLRAVNSAGSGAASSSTQGTPAAPSSPTITASATLTTFTTIYGTPSPSQSFAVSGAALNEGILVTAPTGFEVSIDGLSYASTALFTQVGGSASGTLYVRLAATASVSANYNSLNISLTSSGATTIDISSSSSGNTVSAKGLTISGLTAANKDYDGNSTVNVSGTPTYAGLVNGETFSVTGSVTWTFSSVNPGTNILLTQIGSFQAPTTNYSVTQPSLSANINALIPSAPTINSIAPGISQLSVSFTAPTFNGGASITNYEYTIDGGSNWTLLSPASTISPMILVGLNNGTTYNVIIRAINSIGSGALSNAVQSSTYANIAAWDFFGESSPTSSNADASSNYLSTTPSLTRGSGAASSSGSNSFRTTGFQNNGIAVNNTDYFQTSFSSTNSYTTISTIEAKFIGTTSFYTSPGVTSQFAYSLDGTTFTLIGSPQQSTSLSMTVDATAVAALQNVPAGTTIYFRYFASGQTTTGGWGFSSTAAGIYGLQFGGAFCPLPSAPTASPQSFCSSTSPTISSLTATGSNVQWYAASTGGSAISSSTALQNATNYFASQTVNGCESNRTSVAVTLNADGTWKGGTTGNWNDANNWCGGVPSSSSSVVIGSGNTVTLNVSPTTVSSLTIAGSLTVPTNNQLTLTGALTNNGTFTLENGATFKQGTSVSGGGTYNIQQNLDNCTNDGINPTGRFWYLGSPVTSLRENSFGNAGNLNKVWSFTNGAYTAIADGATLSPTTGYIHRRGSNALPLTFTGTNLYAQDVTLSLSNNAGTYGGWHLIANPYTAYLDWHQVYNASNALSSAISPSYYIRSFNSTGNDVNALITYNSSTGLESNTSSFSISSAQAQYIAPMQAFWVKVNPTTPLSATAGQLRLERAFTSHQTGNVGLKSSTIFPTLARVNLVNGARFDQMLVYMNPDMTNGVDQYDSEKMFVSGASQIYTMAAGKKLVMNGLKNNKSKISVPLYLELPESKVYQLSLAEYILEDGIILLEDKQEGTIQDFTIHDVYSFYATSGVLSNRFVLHFFTPDNGITAQGPSNTWVEEEAVINEGGNILVNSDGRGKVTIQQDIDPSPSAKGNVVVRDAAGREVWKGQLNGSATTLELDTPSGIYFVEVELNGQVEMKKIFVQQ